MQSGRSRKPAVPNVEGDDLQPRAAELGLGTPLTAAHKAGVQHGGPGDVIDEAAPARQKAVVPDPLHAGSGVAGHRSAGCGPLHVLSQWRSTDITE